MNSEGWPAPLQIDLAHGQIVSGKAFSVSFRVLALLLVEGVAWWGYVLWSNGKLGSSVTMSALWLLAALLLMCITVFYVFRSETSITDSFLRQSWIWDKEMQVAELAYVKLIRLRGFDWLIAPRLYARSHSGKFASFYAADIEVLKQFEQISLKLKSR
jgi:aspartyl/asparaginyl-tRNA synthetase